MAWALPWAFLRSSPGVKENYSPLGLNYALLYDRIKVNAGEKQLYGTQFATVDPTTKTAELQPTEDVENLDDRRREMGMMPIRMYKRMIFETL